MFGTAFLQLDRFVSAIAVFLFLYYAYAIVGMELFADYDLKNCCKNTSVESYYAFNVTGQSDGYFYLNNFESLINSYVTLFELTVVNNWFILMEGYAATVSDWSRLYFMIFYLNQMILMSIVVASIIDIYKFRMSYKEQMTKEEGLAEFSLEISLFLVLLSWTFPFLLDLWYVPFVKKKSGNQLIQLSGRLIEYIRPSLGYFCLLPKQYSDLPIFFGNKMGAIRFQVTHAIIFDP